MSSIAVFMVLGGSAYAATALKANSVGASQIKTGAVRSSEVKNGWLLSKDFKPGQLKAGPAGATGPAGAPGATGATGATGAAGAKGDKGDKGDSATTLWAVGNPDGTVARSSGHLGTGTGKVVTGGYQVIFDRDITGCAYLATAGNPGSATPASSYAEVAQRGGNANGVYITTRTDAGTQADQGFHVAVFC